MAQKESFENLIKKLEKIVSDIESGELSLEKAIKAYEEGVKISKSCTQKLDETEQRISLLLRDKSGSISEKVLGDISEIKSNA